MQSTMINLGMIAYHYVSDWYNAGTSDEFEKKGRVKIQNGVFLDIF